METFGFGFDVDDI